MKHNYLNAFHREHSARLKKHLSRQPTASLKDALEQYDRIKRGSSRNVQVRVLTAADLHQARSHYRSLISEAKRVPHLRKRSAPPR